MTATPKICALAAVVLFAGCIVDSPAPTPKPAPTPATAVADGVYDLDSGSCEAAASQTRLTVAGDQFKFYESSCRLQTDSVGTEGIKARLICTGEGEEWVRRVTLQSTPDLLTLSEGEQMFRYHRCS